MAHSFVTSSPGAKGFRAIGVDNKDKIRPVASHILWLDLTDAVCQLQLLDLVSHTDHFFTHLAPRGSSNRAMDRPLPKNAVDAGLPEPARCRSEEFPGGPAGLAEAHSRLFLRVLSNNGIVVLLSSRSVADRFVGFLDPREP